MSYDFTYKGGVLKKSRHLNEKFLLFFIVGGKEIPIYQMKENNLVWAKGAYPARLSPSGVSFPQSTFVPTGTMEAGNYATASNVVKVFLSHSGFGQQSKYYSFYLKLLSGAGNVVTIVPFSGANSGFSFKATAKFLKKKEVMEVLSEESQSWSFLQRQKMLPIDILRSVVEIDKSHVRKGIRHIKVGKKGK